MKHVSLVSPEDAPSRARDERPHPSMPPPVLVDAAGEGAEPGRRLEPRRLRVLIADDDRSSRSRLQALVEKWEYEAVLAANGAEAIRILASENPPRLALIDWVMPAVDGLKVCQYIRRGTGRYVYTIVLTGRRTPEAAVEAMRSGADDYVPKPFHEGELELRLRTGRRIVELEDQLSLTAARDPLTGVWGRASIQAFLDQQLSKSRRERSSLSVLLIDLDYFKRINDAHGHPAGDRVLRGVAQRMRRTLRSYDGLGRFGGEEFLAVLPDTDLSRGRVAAERIRRAIADAGVETPSGTLPVTTSIGVACGVGGDTSTEELVASADAALYRAKHAGRNRVEVAAPDGRDDAAH